MWLRRCFLQSPENAIRVRENWASSSVRFLPCPFPPALSHLFDLVNFHYLVAPFVKKKNSPQVFLHFITHPHLLISSAPSVENVGCTVALRIQTLSLGERDTVPQPNPSQRYSFIFVQVLPTEDVFLNDSVPRVVLRATFVQDVMHSSPVVQRASI